MPKSHSSLHIEPRPFLTKGMRQMVKIYLDKSTYRDRVVAGSLVMAVVVPLPEDPLLDHITNVLKKYVGAVNPNQESNASLYS